ncbi:hypothetical protein [Mucilaginibacter xinganensis]|uniref:Uncharacterized protein n=1 Tax=Mucilaginibacter xinganensis TaxID=1234841 RepID=A0A223NWY7_9SPHI|nr:hypothetical protein [Mucilaginibacter xinganensis]ASU34387.1 hypothetical protein MuYL_2500 [Mucilaginibacter xinganensis]
MQTETYTNENGTEILVHFDDLQVELLDRCDHSAFYKCTGYDANGTEYVGTAEFCCGEFEAITDIEEL